MPGVHWDLFIVIFFFCIEIIQAMPHGVQHAEPWNPSGKNLHLGVTI